LGASSVPKSSAVPESSLMRSEPLNETSNRYSEPAGKSWVRVIAGWAAGSGSKEGEVEESESPGRSVVMLGCCTAVVGLGGEGRSEVRGGKNALAGGCSNGSGRVIRSV